MTNKFKVGDKVRVKKDIESCKDYNECYFSTSMEKYRGKTYTITKAYQSFGEDRYSLESIGSYCFSNDMLEPFSFTKNDLQNGDVVTLRNGDKLYLNDCMNFTDIAEANFNWLEDTDDLTDNLLYKNDDKDYDIIKVERPTYTTVFERDEEVKEMTLKEICDALGYDVKVIKEDE